MTIMSEVRTHVNESGEDPYDTFGQPRIYAKAFAEGSRRRWLWGASLAVTIAAFTSSIFLFASAIARHSDFRPLPLGGHVWVVVATGIIAALIAWRAFLVVSVRPLSSLAYDESEASASWKGWVWRRRYTTIVVVVALSIGSLLWGQSLGTNFRNSPKLHASSYVWATASSPTNSFGQQSQLITASTVIYLSAPGPATMLNNLSLSRNWIGNNDTSNLIAFPTLATALSAARNHNFSGNGNDAPFTTLKYGTFYVLEYFSSITPTVGAPSPAESLDVGYSVNHGVIKTLSIGLPINFSNAN
ncbi:MAG: hypothetical protein ACYC19_07375 [Acidimicrobiales bacterium]